MQRMNFPKRINKGIGGVVIIIIIIIIINYLWPVSLFQSSL